MTSPGSLPPYRELPPRFRRRLPWSLLGALLFFCLLWRLDFPKPMVDDLFYTGAAFHLAHGGDYSNPLLARQEFPGHFFFVYPPIHSFALAAWLKIFGLSAASVTGFQNLAYFIIAAATILLLRKYRSPAWLEWLVPLGVTTAFLAAGLRTEALATAFIMAGLALLECPEHPPLAGFPGFLLLMLGGMTAPRSTVFAAAFVLLAAWRFSRDPILAPHRKILLAAALAAAAVAILLFLWMIGFRLAEFLQVFQFHANGVFTRFGAGILKFSERFIHIQTAGQWPLLLLPIPLLLLLAVQRPLDRAAWSGLALAIAFIITALIRGLYYGSGWFPILIALFLAVSLRQKIQLRGRVVVAGGLTAVFFAANAPLVSEVLLIALGEIHADRGPQAAAALALRPDARHPLLVDVSAARYLYDYRLPEGALNYEFSSRFPAWHVTQSPLRPGDIYLVGPAAIQVLNEYTFLDAPLPESFTVARHRWVFFRHPRELFVITSEQCGGLRPQPPPPP